jgi:hypothetical protein
MNYVITLFLSNFMSLNVRSVRLQLQAGACRALARRMACRAPAGGVLDVAYQIAVVALPVDN